MASRTRSRRRRLGATGGPASRTTRAAANASRDDGVYDRGPRDRGTTISALNIAGRIAAGKVAAPVYPTRYSSTRGRLEKLTEDAARQQPLSPVLERDLADLRRLRAHRHLALQPFPEPLLLNLEIVAGLQVEPEPLRRTKIPGEPGRGVCGNRPLTMYDLINPTRGHADILRQLILTDSQGIQKLTEKNLAGMNDR